MQMWYLPEISQSSLGTKMNIEKQKWAKLKAIFSIIDRNNKKAHTTIQHLTPI